MKDISENIQTAKDIIREYENTTEIVKIIELLKRLSLYSVFLWENLAYLKKQYNSSYFVRKIEVSKSYLNNKAKKITDKQALMEADTINEELYKQESDSEALALRLEIFLRQCNRVIDSMRTEISFLKAEANRTTSSDL